MAAKPENTKAAKAETPASGSSSPPSSSSPSPAADDEDLEEPELEREERGAGKLPSAPRPRPIVGMPIQVYRHDGGAPCAGIVLGVSPIDGSISASKIQGTGHATAIGPLHYRPEGGPRSWRHITDAIDEAERLELARQKAAAEAAALALKKGK